MLLLQSVTVMLPLQSAAAIVRLGATDQVIISAVATCASLYLKTMIAKQNHCIENGGRFNRENVFAKYRCSRGSKRD